MKSKLMMKDAHDYSISRTFLSNMKLNGWVGKSVILRCILEFVVKKMVNSYYLIDSCLI